MIDETALQLAIRYNKHALVSAWESFKREATAARVERARKVMIHDVAICYRGDLTHHIIPSSNLSSQDLEDRMVLALHCSTVAADGESPSTLLGDFCRNHSEMMLPVMYAFMGDSLLKDMMDGKLPVGMCFI